MTIGHFVIKAMNKRKTFNLKNKLNIYVKIQKELNKKDSAYRFTIKFIVIVKVGL